MRCRNFGNELGKLGNGRLNGGLVGGGNLLAQSQIFRIQPGAGSDGSVRTKPPASAIGEENGPRCRSR